MYLLASIPYVLVERERVVYGEQELMTLILQVNQLSQVADVLVLVRVERSKLALLNRILIGSTKVPGARLNAESAGDTMRSIPVDEVAR